MVAVGLLICLGTGELALQLVLGNMNAAPFKTTDDDRCTSLAPGESVEYTGSGFRIDPVVHDVNDRGFRGTSRPRKKADGTFRVSVLGDSYIYGMGVATGQTISDHLEVVLRKEERDVEVLNFGVPALDFFNAIEQWRHFAGQWETDLVLFQLSDVDPEKCALLDRPILCWFMKNVRLIRIAYRVYKTTQGNRFRERYLGSGSVPADIIQGMRVLKDLTDLKGARLVMMVFFDPWDNTTAVSGMLREMDIPWIGIDRASIPVVRHEGHFSSDGNRSVAEQVAAALLRLELFGEP